MAKVADTNNTILYKIRADFSGKVDTFLKGSLDSIQSPSPSVKIQNMGGNICFRCKGKILLGIVNKVLKKFVDFTQ